MTLSQALFYFLREAGANLFRSWRISGLAILTISVSLFLAGAFILVGGNLSGLVENLRAEGRITLYLVVDAPAGALEDLAGEISKAEWVLGVEPISSEAAAVRFAQAFPSLQTLLEGENSTELPESLEISPDWNFVQANPVTISEWSARMTAHPAVDFVDADRDWLRQLEVIVALVRMAGVVLGGILLTTSVFTISSVIRLMAYLYREEIAVMRLVGATEFFIRGPFYAEGWMQGTLGGCMALVALLLSHSGLLEMYEHVAVLTMVVPNFLSAAEAGLLPLLGGAAGLLGAVVSLHKEDLGAGEQDERTDSE